jgi:hypothetical protein
MFRVGTFLSAVLLLVATLNAASAQIATPVPTEAKQSRVKLTTQKLRDMKAKWSANKGKLKVCRQEVKVKGLAGDDRWFYIEDCMSRTPG